MKPTPIPRLHWSLVGLVAAGSVLLPWGCGHTREILHPERKTSPPRLLKNRFAGPKRPPEAPLEVVPPARGPTPLPLDAPTAVDVPIIDRNQS